MTLSVKKHRRGEDHEKEQENNSGNLFGVEYGASGWSWFYEE